MAISFTLELFLADRRVPYRVLEHPRTQTTTETAQESRISGETIAKGVLLKGGGDYMLAVLPASRKIQFPELQDCVQRAFDMASEEEVGVWFSDCDIGAIPPIGQAFGLDVVLDESLAEHPDVYFEGGDHCTLVHLKRDDFRRMMVGSQSGRFSFHG